MKRNRIIWIFSLLLTFSLGAQEVEVPLTYDIQLLKESTKQKKSSNAEKSMISLPFIDDFSIDKTFNNPDGNQVLWEESCARRNETFAVNAPSIGVMTFDGLDCTGFPYNFENANDFGVADTLESVDIDLSSTSGLVVMSFFFQAEGLGNRPEASDSLVLEFFEPDSNKWHWAWSSPGRALSEFEQVLIPIDSTIFLEPDFRIRFKNYATLSGALDHWNIDYIEIDDNRSLTDTINQDLAFFEPQFSLTEEYSSVPWDHFDNSLIRENILLQIKNNGNNGSFQDNNFLEIFESGVLQTSYQNIFDPSVSAGSTQGYNYDLNGGNIEYDSSLPGPVNFDVEFSYNVSPDFILDNNRLKFTQSFDDFYAYDDGSAERGYGVDIAGGQVAYKFDFLQPDSISALYMYFLPVAQDPSDEQFFLTIWSHDADLNCPDTIIQQSTIAAPSFVDYQVAPDYFLVYPLQEKVFVDASQPIWIGWQQSGDLSLNIGNDKNTNNNANRLKFNVNGTWNPSAITGTLMMRPAVGDIPIVSVNEISDKDINLYPNPSNGVVYLELPQIANKWRYEVFNISGQIIAQDFLQTNSIDLSQSNNGLYWIRLSNPYLSPPITKKIVLVR